MTELQTFLPRDNVPAKRDVRIQKQAEGPESQAQLSHQVDGGPKPNDSEPNYATSNLPTD